MTAQTGSMKMVPRDGDSIASKAAPVVRTLEPSQAWVKVSIAEAARMSVESMQIVARSKEMCLRTRGVGSADPAWDQQP